MVCFMSELKTSKHSQTYLIQIEKKSETFLETAT